ncbi:MAG TPA: dTMP kinase [Phycisphaerales bacterium]|nr:dTMP kinase [Phycisphaerales bacterium]
MTDPPPSHWGDVSFLAALRGRFVVFDGPDGSGKSTQFRRFAALCRETDMTVCEVREPGGTHVGERVREILLDPVHAEMSLRCEMMLYMASRAQLVEERIRPALSRGELVLADRYVTSTLAYQGSAGGLPFDEIMAVAQAACGRLTWGAGNAERGSRNAEQGLVGAWPELVVIFDVDERTAAGRLNPLLDRMEQKGLEFHRKVRAGYLEQAKRWPERYLVVDASKDADDVTKQLLAGVRQRVGSM